MLEKIKHGLYCGINLTNTSLIEENLYGLGYDILQCNYCKKEYILLRADNNYLELYDDNMKEILDNVNNKIIRYNKFIKDTENLYIIKSDVFEYINYPLGKKDILIEYIVEKKTGEYIENNVYFEDIIKLFYNN